MASRLDWHDDSVADRRVSLLNVLPLCVDSVTQEVAPTRRSNCMRIKYSVFTDQNTCNLLISLGSLDRIKVIPVEIDGVKNAICIKHKLQCATCKNF